MHSLKYFYGIFYASILVVIQNGNAQSLLPESPVSSSIANASVALPDGLSFALNPAQSRADSIHTIHAALAYTPFVGGLQSADQSAIEATYYSALTHLSFSLGATNLSYSDIYSDLAFNFSIQRTFDLAMSRHASTGIRLRYETLGTTPSYPKLHFLFVDLGFTLDLTKEFSLGGAALNLLGEKYDLVNSETEKLVRRFLFGIVYHPERFPLKFLTSVEESSIESLALQFGAEYDPVKIGR